MRVHLRSELQRAWNSWAYRLTFVVIVVYAIHLAIGAYAQFLDADEGGYMLLSRLAAEGQMPQLDFFAPQMPMFFYIYGYFMKVFGHSFEAARGLSALFCLLGLIAFSLTWRELSQRKSGWVVFAAAVLFSMNLNYFVQGVQVKHYAPGLNLLMIAFFFLIRWSKQIFEEGKVVSWTLFFAAFFLGVAANTRSFVIIILPVVAVWMAVQVIVGRPRIATLSRAVLIAGAGFGIPSVPTLVITAKSFEHLRFNVETAMMKYYAPTVHLTSEAREKLFILTHVNDPQYLLLLGCGVFGIAVFILAWLLARVLKRPHRAGALRHGCFVISALALNVCAGVLLGGYYYLKSPIFSYIQWTYMTPFYLFVAMTGILALSVIRPIRLGVVTAVSTFLGVYSGGFLFKGVRSELTFNLPQYGNHEVALRDQSPWTYLLYDHRNYQNGGSYRSISTIKRVADYLKQNTAEDEVVLAWLNAPVFLSSRRPVKGFEEGVGMNEIFWKLDGPTVEEGKRFHVIRKDQLADQIKRREIGTIIVDPYTEPDLAQMIEKHYVLATKITQYLIYRR